MKRMVNRAGNDATDVQWWAERTLGTKKNRGPHQKKFHKPVKILLGVPFFALELILNFHSYYPLKQKKNRSISLIMLL